MRFDSLLFPVSLFRTHTQPPFGSFFLFFLLIIKLTFLILRFHRLFYLSFFPFPFFLFFLLPSHCEVHISRASAAVEALYIRESKAILDQRWDLPPEVDVGDHVNSPGLVSLVLDQHSNGQVEKQGNKEDDAKDTACAETSHALGAGVRRLPAHVVGAGASDRGEHWGANV